MKLRVLPYKMSSESARALARGLGALRLYSDSTTYRPRQSHLIINWGLSTIPSWWVGQPILNKFSAVKIASNKLKTLQMFSTYDEPEFLTHAEDSDVVACPDWTCNTASAEHWIELGHKVYCRKTLTGHSGSGIIVASTVEELVDAPLYTKGVNAGKEYRVHVFNGKVIDYVKKGRRVSDESERPSTLIRNYSKGWVFIRENIALPSVVEEMSIKAVQRLGLDFGAVDVATLRGDDTKCVVYEVNTSPGFTRESTTCKSYVEAIKSLGGVR